MRSRRAQVARLRQVALAGLDRYPLPEGRLTFVAHGENTTFRHDSSAGRQLVRVHRNQRHGRGVDSTAAIRSELDWLRAIRADTDLAVPEPLAVGSPNDEFPFSWGLYRWLEGIPFQRDQLTDPSAAARRWRRATDSSARLSRSFGMSSTPGSCSRRGRRRSR